MSTLDNNRRKHDDLRTMVDSACVGVMPHIVNRIKDAARRAYFLGCRDGMELARECAIVLHRHGVSDKVRAAASKCKGWPASLDCRISSARSVVELARNRARMVELLERHWRPNGASRLLTSTRVPCAAPACVIARHEPQAGLLLACVMRQLQAARL